MKKIKVLFIHHSTGGLLLFFGRVRKILKEKNPNIELWDHGYNLYSPKILLYLFGLFPLTLIQTSMPIKKLARYFRTF